MNFTSKKINKKKGAKPTIPYANSGYLRSVQLKPGFCCLLFLYLYLLFFPMQACVAFCKYRKIPRILFLKDLLLWMKSDKLDMKKKQF